MEDYMKIDIKNGKAIPRTEEALAAYLADALKDYNELIEGAGATIKDVVAYYVPYWVEEDAGVYKNDIDLTVATKVLPRIMNAFYRVAAERALELNKPAGAGEK